MRASARRARQDPSRPICRASLSTEEPSRQGGEATPLAPWRGEAEVALERVEVELDGTTVARLGPEQLLLAGTVRAVGRLLLDQPDPLLDLGRIGAGAVAAELASCRPMQGEKAITGKLRRLEQGGRPRVLDLFSGCGGLSLGFLAAGFEIAAGIESDPHAAASHGRNFHTGSAAHARPRDITETTPAALVRALRPGPVADAVDVVVGGPPCQAFARIGRAKLREIAEHPQAFLHDPRADLHGHWLAWIAAFRPLAVLIENVPDMLNLAGRNLAEEIAGELDAMGLRCGYTLLNAAHFGVPQMRERLFLLALHQQLAVTPSFPSPTHRLELPRGYKSSRDVATRHLGRANDLFVTSHWIEPAVPASDLPPAVTAREAIGDLLALCPMADPSARRGPRRLDRPMPYRPGEPSAYARRMRAWPGMEAPAEGPRDHVVRHLPRDWPIFAAMRPGDEYPAALQIAEALFAERLAVEACAGRHVETGSARWHELRKATVPPYKADRFPNKWWKLDPHRPSRTLMAHLGKDSYSHIHWDGAQARPISVREAARLQSFPDGFVFEGTMNPAFRQIGNAVPPLLANAVASHCLMLLRRAAVAASPEVMVA